MLCPLPLLLLLQQLVRGDVVIIVATAPLDPVSPHVQQLIARLEGLWETTLGPLLSASDCVYPRADQFPIVLAADYRYLDDITSAITAALRAMLGTTPTPDHALGMPVNHLKRTASHLKRTSKKKLGSWLAD